MIKTTVLGMVAYSLCIDMGLNVLEVSYNFSVALCVKRSHVKICLSEDKINLLRGYFVSSFNDEGWNTLVTVSQC